MRKFLFVSLMIMALSAVAVCNQSCKAWRTVTTTSTYAASNDSTKTAISITSKTSEEYVGVRKK
jgi:predicted secreted Zn-dependent protease